MGAAQSAPPSADAGPNTGSTSADASAPVATTTATTPAAPVVAPEDEARRNAARQHFQRGVELIRGGQWSEALIELEQARDLRATPPVYFNLALAQRAVGRHRGAVASLRQFLRTVSSTADPALISQAEQALHDSLAAVCRVDVSVDPVQARVEIDGTVQEVLGSTVELDPGEHTIVATADGFARSERRIRLARGTNTVASLTLVRTNELSFLRVETNVANAIVRVDGREVGTGTVDEIVRAGHHTVDIIGPHHTPFTREIQSFVGQRQVVRANLTDRRTVFESPWFWVVTGAVVVGGITTAVILWPPPPPYVGSLGVIDAQH